MDSCRACSSIAFAVDSLDELSLLAVLSKSLSDFGQLNSDISFLDRDIAPNLGEDALLPVIRQHPKEPVRQISTMRWGLIPSWAKDTSGAARMINTRSETASIKPAFRDPLKLRRCLIPADGFYEWARKGASKQPYCFEVNEGELFAFAGLWERWRDPSGQWVKSCSILTTTPNAVTSAIHDRMPVILDRNSRFVARSGHDKGRSRLRLVEILRCSTDAVLSRKHSDQSRGERRRGVFAPCRAFRHSESAF